MPQRKSAKKELKKSLKRRKLNLTRKKAIKEAIKNFKKAIQNKNKEEIRNSLSSVYKILDKAAAKKVIHPNKAARKKRKIATLFNQFLSSSSAPQEAS